jgi:hypothetical protein
LSDEIVLQLDEQQKNKGLLGWMRRNWKKIGTGLFIATFFGAAAYFLHAQKSQEKKPEKYAIILESLGMPLAAQRGEVPESILPESVAYNSLITHAEIPPDHITKLYNGTLNDLKNWANLVSKRQERMILLW